MYVPTNKYVPYVGSVAPYLQYSTSAVPCYVPEAPDCLYEIIPSQIISFIFKNIHNIHSITSTRKMTSKALVIALFLLFCLQDTTCLASSAGSNESRHVLSTSKNGGHSKTFFFDGSSTVVSSYRDFDSLTKKVQSVIRSTFLPSGYPNRTPPGYLKFSMFSWIQDLSTQLRSVLATQRVLEGVGVGREGATALSALMNYLVRDGCGMIATLLFTSVASSRFRTDVKRWRLFADLMVDLGITLEVTAVLVPRALFLPMICIGNMCKALCGVAAGACGGSINLHWAKGSDISDINAKFGAQHTVTGALGLVFAAFFARSVDHVNPVRLWALYSSLTFLHIFANMQCMRIIAFDSPNTVRMNMLLAEFLAAPSKTTNTTTPALLKHSLSDNPLSSPIQVAQTEPLFFGMPGKYRKPPGPIPIHFGCSFNEFWERSGKSSVAPLDRKSLLTTKDNYILSSGGGGGGGKSSTHPCVVVSFLSHATPLQEAKAYFHANLIGNEIIQKRAVVGSSKALTEEERLDADAKAGQLVDKAWGKFQRSCKAAGWDLSKAELRTKGYEVQFID